MNKLGEEVVIPPKDEEEVYLEKLVFGDQDGFENNLKKIDNLYDYSSDEQEGSDKFFRDSDSESDDEDEGMENVQDADLFYIDDGEANEKLEDEMDVDDEIIESDQDESDGEQSDVWEDSDDERLNISLVSTDKLKKLRKTETDSIINGKSYITRLRSQFERIYPRPDWIDEIDEEKDEDSDIDLDDDEKEGSTLENDTNAILNILSTSLKFIKTKQLKLISPVNISITRLKDANYQKPSKAAIQSISFHSNHPLLLTGGFDRTLRIYYIDGKINQFVTSLHLRNSPIASCQFAPIAPGQSDLDKNLIFAGGRRRYMNKWDLNNGQVEKISRLYGHEKYQKSFEYFKISPKGSYIGLTGNSGWCNLLNGSTGQWIRGFKVEGTIIDFDFAKDESFIIITNTAGEIWEFDLNNTPSSKNKEKVYNKIIRKWNDDGGIGITKIKLGGPKYKWVAVGTNNGIVNIYDRTNFQDNINPKPIKTIENLVTSISTLAFSPDGQLLVIASRAKRDALKIIHLPTATVYANWPTSGTPLGKVTVADFSPNNEILAIGNEAGKVTLWKLNHY